MLLFSMPKNDLWIREMAGKGMIEPFDDTPAKEDGISSGISSYGYDMRVADEFKILAGECASGVTDPKDIGNGHFTDFRGDVCVIPPNSYALGRSLEYFRIPRDVLVICFGKSTYARCGIVVNVTPLEPEWEGHLTISISNTTPCPARIYACEGIAQLIFLGADEICGTSYADRTGKYQAQTKITLSRT
jgi:dCTP deaminase